MSTKQLIDALGAIENVLVDILQELRTLATSVDAIDDNTRGTANDIARIASDVSSLETSVFGIDLKID